MISSALQGIEQDLAAGRIIVIDGATGTELERRGARMHDRAWSAMANLEEPELLRTVHEDYIKAGARVIISNTYSSNRSVVEAAGLGSKFEAINRRAVEIAREARERTATEDSVAVAGSLSHHVSMQKGTDWRDPGAVPPAGVAEAQFREKAELLAASGADLIMMEMMSDPDLANPAIAAALATGLPVWVGFSVLSTESGGLCACSRQDLDVATMLDNIALDGVSVAGIMHSLPDTVSPALAELKARWQGPLMCYPDSGYFEMPHWQFVDIIDVHEFVACNDDWIRAGVQIVGGCCGLGLEHIEALARHLEHT